MNGFSLHIEPPLVPLYMSLGQLIVYHFPINYSVGSRIFTEKYRSLTPMLRTSNINLFVIL